ncbi:MAG: endopeptidase La [Bacteroidales bacterium]|nr:endopeptidase La [Bacteroidales bacterium]
MDLLKDLDIFEADDSDAFSARAEIIPLITKEDESFLLNEDSIPDDMPLLPLHGNVLFPGVVLPIGVSRKASLRLLRDAEKNHERIIVVAQRNDNQLPEMDDLYQIGVIARVLRVIELPRDNHLAIIQGTMKCQLLSITAEEPYYRGCAVLIDENNHQPRSRSFHNRVLAIRKEYSDMEQMKNNGVGLNPKDIFNSLGNITSDKILINFIASHLDIPVKPKQEMLDADGYDRRSIMLLEQLQKENDYYRVRDDIQGKTRQELDRQQREYFLNQQMRVIQDELGGASSDKDIERLVARAQKKKWGKEAQDAFNHSIEKLRRTSPQTPDYTVELNYAELLLDMPWNVYSKDDLRTSHARKVLDRDHYGMEKVKERIIEYIAVLSLKDDMKSPILCLVGPPGTGKTSLGKSIAEAMHRKYVRVALGGLHDEAEIRGHRKTYVGAMPGRIVQSLKKAGVSNPVFVLDEIDKVQGMSHNGDPTSALLEVLDPEQNKAFHDNYLELDYDLSHVLFIATANTLSTIQPALLDRLEVIDLSGYILEEKLEIAQRHLIPRQLKEHGFTRRDLKFSNDLLKVIINDYTRESGVRQLEKTIAKIIRRRAVQKAEGNEYSRDVKQEELKDILGLPIHNSERRGKDPKVGVVTGLAWTQVGGEILFIESSISKGKGTLSMTGNLGDVMKESATLAFEYIKANADRFGIDAEKLENSNIHIHVPEGATPKDGPSAGITMFVAMVSAFTQRKVIPTVAMTGEITLRGAVTPVGGIKEKILAAKRADITDIILCEDNRRDIEEIPADYLKGLTFHYITDMEEALPIAFGQ